MKNRINILFVSDAFGVSGAEFVILDILKNINTEVFQPFVFCNGANTRLIEIVSNLGIRYATTSNYPETDKIGSSGVSPTKLAAYLFGIIGIFLDLVRTLKKWDIDIIHANAYPNCLFCLLPALFCKRKLVWHVHNIREIHVLNRMNYRIAGLLCNKIITVSDACKRNLLKAGIAPSRFVTIFNGMDLNKLTLYLDYSYVRKGLNIGKEVPVVGLFGQPLPEKGHKFFIEAAAKVKEKFPNVKFLVVGHLFENEYQKQLYNLVSDLNISETVIFTGWRNDVPNVMASIDVLAHTRFTPEPAALVLMEAMAMGKPVVASNTGGTAELIHNNVTGYLVPPSDSETLGTQIIQLLKDPVRAKQMGLNGRKRVEEKFTLKKQVQSIEKLFLEIARR